MGPQLYGAPPQVCCISFDICAWGSTSASTESTRGRWVSCCYIKMIAMLTSLSGAIDASPVRLTIMVMDLSLWPSRFLVARCFHKKSLGLELCRVHPA